MIQINKERFLEIMKVLDDETEKLETLNSAIDSVSDGWVILELGNQYRDLIISFLEEYFHDEDTISWYLYEDVEKKIFDLNDNVLFEIKSYEDLFDYLEENRIEYETREENLEN